MPEKTPNRGYLVLWFCAAPGAPVLGGLCPLFPRKRKFST